jgi:predicted nucleic acid-binding Zn ribbon protein
MEPEKRLEPQEMSEKKASESMGEIIPAVLRMLGLEGRMDEGRLVREWPLIVGELLASKSCPLVIREGVLTVEVRDNSWMQEIRFHQKRIIEKINDRFPDLGVNAIRLRMERVRDGD